MQLAVLAHVRHTKTDYDNLLKIVGWHDARRLVEQTCLDQIVKWRGETDEGDGELEDIFQEVIVLDDDDKEETRDATARQEHESSVEVIADQRHPEDVDVDAYSPPPLTTKQSVPKEQPRSDSPTVISVMPLRAPKPAPLLTHQAFNDRLQDTKHRVGHGRGPEPMMVPEHQTNVAPAQSRQGQAREETRSKSTANASSYALDREVVEERLLQRRLPSQKISFRPPQAQVYQSIEHASEQQRPRAQPDAVRRAMPQRSLPRSTVMPQRPHEIMPYDRPPAQTKPPVPPPQYVGLQNGRTAHVEATSQRGVEPSRDDRQHQEVIDLTETSPVAQKTATKTRVNARPTSLTARQRTRSRSPDRGQMYHEPDPRPVNDSQYYRDDGRRSYAQPEYRERRDPFHRRPEAGYDGDRRRLHEFDALGNRLERYAMYDLEDDEIRGAQFRVQDLQQAPPRPRSAGHYVVRNRLERLYDRDAAYADRAALSREYYPQKDQWPPADRYRDRSDLYLVPHRPA